MKRIAIVFADTKFGGAATALIGMLKALDYSQYEVTLFTNINDNPELMCLPDYIRIIDLEASNTKRLGHYYIEKKKFHLFMKLVFSYCISRFVKDKVKNFEVLTRGLPISFIHYDCAIAYNNSYQTLSTTLFQLHASKKVLWVHGDDLFTAYRSWVIRFDQIFGVSESLTVNLKNQYPLIADRIGVFKNIVDKEDVLAKSKEQIEQIKEPYILTVGNLRPVKGQIIIPHIMRMLLDNGFNIKWYLIGEGQSRNDIEKAVITYGVENNVILLGKKENPYPYMKDCTIYVQTSFSEGWGLTVQEAKILQKPIVVTRIATFVEQIENGYNGLVSETNDETGLFNQIVTLLRDSNMRERFSNNLFSEDYNDVREIEKLYAVINTANES